jgi:hypothetical protein
MKSAIIGLAFSLGDRMTLSDLASIGGLISGLAVLASLVFLYFQLRQMNAQVRQAERNQLAAIRLGRVAQRIHVNIALMEPSAADAYLKGMSGADDITSTQYSQFSAYCRCIFAAGQDGLSQHKSGLVDDADFDILKQSMKIWLSSPGVRLVWKNIRSLYSIDFAELMDREMAGISASPPVDPYANWKIEIAAEKMAPNSAKVRTT